MSAKGTRGREHPLKFEAGDDIRRFLVPIDIVSLWFEHLTPRCNNDSPCLDGQLSLLILEIDGLGRTELLAHLAFPFGEEDTIDRVNGIFQRNRLGIFDVDRLSFAKACIIFVVDLRWTFFSTETTGNAFRRIHIARLLNQLDLKISHLSGDALHL